MGFHGTAVSLRTLQKRLKSCQQKVFCPNETLQLAGIKKLIGYVTDKENRDLIILGESDSSLPFLSLEDLVVALRNTWMKHSVLKGNSYYHSDPRCSIDPDHRVIKRLQKIAKRIMSNNSTPDTIEKYIDEWHEVCSSPQRVTVLGIPFNSHFAHVMVKADYEMKRLVDGSDQINIPGFTSLTESILEEVKSDWLQGKPISVYVSVLNRFWFYPGEYQYLEDEGIVLAIAQPQVKLLTEEEFLNKKGMVVGKGSPNPSANKVAEDFTALYSRISKERPIYQELENLYSFVALSKIIKFRRALSKAKLNLDYVLNHFKITKRDVSPVLSGRSNVMREEVTSGDDIAMFWIPTCGGVDMGVEISEESLEKDTSGDLSRLKSVILGSRPSKDSLSWRYNM